MWFQDDTVNTHHSRVSTCILTSLPTLHVCTYFQRDAWVVLGQAIVRRGEYIFLCQLQVANRLRWGLQLRNQALTVTTAYDVTILILILDIGSHLGGTTLVGRHVLGLGLCRYGHQIDVIRHVREHTGDIEYHRVVDTLLRCKLNMSLVSSFTWYLLTSLMAF